MSEWIKNNIKKFSLLSGATLIAIGGLIKIISDELQEWHAIVFRSEPQKVERDENIKRIDMKKDSLLNEINKLDKEKQTARRIQ